MIKNTISRIYPLLAVTFAAVLVSLVVVASCSPYHSMQLKEDPHASRDRPPTDAFVIVSISTSITADKCDPPTENCLAIIDELPPIKSKKTGSGMALWHEGKVYIITAEHVCSDEDEPSHFKYPDKDIRIKLKVNSRFYVTGVDGVPQETKVVSLNKDMDLCALDATNFKGGSISLALGPPRIGDRVYALAAPYGLGGESLSLIFEGYYSGYRNSRHYYTLPTRPGSSGALVLNQNWRAVGSLHTAFIPLENVGIGAGWQDIKLFLESINR